MLGFWFSREDVRIKALENISKMLMACVLAASLAAPVVPLGSAWADEVSEATAALEEAEARMEQIAEEYANLAAQIEDLQAQIDEAAEGVMDAQSAVQEGRDKLGEMVLYEYKTGGISILKVLFGSQNLGELIDNLHYIESVQEAQARVIEEQKQREQELSDALDDLNAKKDSQMAALEEAEAKNREAAELVSNAQAQLEQAEADAEAERLAALQKAAEELAAAQAEAAAAQETPTSESSDSSGVDDSASGSSDSSSSGSGSASGSSGESSSSENTSTEIGSGWKTGLASAYGTEADGTLGASTAAGATVTETSMGVAIPMSWPNYRSYFGRSVEISYGGRTVVAVVNDCGGLDGGSRALDLQPGVCKALGFSSPDAWGVREVSYRFL